MCRFVKLTVVTELARPWRIARYQHLCYLESMIQCKAISCLYGFFCRDLRQVCGVYFEKSWENLTYVPLYISMLLMFSAKETHKNCKKINIMDKTIYNSLEIQIRLEKVFVGLSMQWSILPKCHHLKAERKKLSRYLCSGEEINITFRTSCRERNSAGVLPRNGYYS